MKPIAPLHHRGRPFLLGLVVSIAPTFAAAAEQASNPPASQEPLVQLPPLLVEVPGKRLEWRYLSLPGFEVLSVCSDEVTRMFVERCLRLEQLLRQILPARFQAQFAVPEKLILFNEELGHARSHEVVDEMLRHYGLQKPEVRPDFILPWQTQAPDNPFKKRPSQFFLPNLRLADIDSTVVFAAIADSPSVRMDFNYQPERIAYILERRTPALPEWFAVGMIRCFSRTVLRSDTIEIDRAVWLSAEESQALAKDPDRPRTLLPMQELLTWPPPRTPELDTVWREQCALFVRWAIAADHGARRESLWMLVERLETEPLSEALFRECFGLGFADVRDRLSDYLSSATRSGTILRSDERPETRSLHFRSATKAEIARICGEWERLEIAYVKKHIPELTEKYIEQARRRVANAMRDGADDPELLATKAFIEIDAGNPALAREDLEAAVARKVLRPRAYLELAQLRLDAALAEAGDGKLTASQAAAVLTPLAAASAMEPALAEVFAQMVRTFNAADAPPGADDLDRLHRGIARFPRMSPLILAGVFFAFTNGRYEAAQELAVAGRLHARDEAFRAKFTQILEQLRTTSPTETAPGSRSGP